MFKDCHFFILALNHLVAYVFHDDARPRLSFTVKLLLKNFLSFLSKSVPLGDPHELSSLLLSTD